LIDYVGGTDVAGVFINVISTINIAVLYKDGSIAMTDSTQSSYKMLDDEARSQYSSILKATLLFGYNNHHSFMIENSNVYLLSADYGKFYNTKFDDGEEVGSLLDIDEINRLGKPKRNINPNKITGISSFKVLDDANVNVIKSGYIISEDNHYVVVEFVIKNEIVKTILIVEEGYSDTIIKVHYSYHYQYELISGILYISSGSEYEEDLEEFKIRGVRDFFIEKSVIRDNLYVITDDMKLLLISTYKSDVSPRITNIKGLGISNPEFEQSYSHIGGRRNVKRATGY